MKCAVYIRVSTDREEQKTSLVNQRQLFEKYIQDKHWDLHDFYVDIESGTKAKRTNFQRMLEDAKAKKFNIILTKELSRLARNVKLAYQIKEIAENNNIEILSFDNSINTLENNTALFGAYAWIYEEESQRISRRMKSALKMSAERGRFKGSFAPYGYYVKDKKLYVRNDNTPNIVKRIFSDYLAGKGFDRIARELYNEGIPTPGQVANKADASDKWHGGSVRTILENPHYTGDLVQGRSTTISVTSNRRTHKSKEDYIIIKNAHEPIISKNDFEAVQQLIKSRKKIRPHQNIHLFTNLLFCHDCGHGMHFKKNRKGYICGSFNRHGLKACSSHIVREKELVDLIITDLKAMLSTIENKKLLNELQKNVDIKKKRLENEAKRFSREIEKLNIRKSKALTKFINDDISKEDYNTFISMINDNINELTKKQKEYDSLISEKFNTDILNELYSLKDTIINLNELTPEILNRLIERIEIKADGTPKIFYRFSESSIYFSALFSNTQHSTCFVIGNISTGCTSTVLYPCSSKYFKSLARVLGSHDT